MPSAAIARFASQFRSPFSSVVVFGDSLSDSGNLYDLSGHTWPADSSYFRGRLTDGLTWVEYLARDLGLLPGGVDLLNLACGGATINNARTQGYAGYASDIPVPSVADQVERYLASHTKQSIRRSLFIVNGGGNDGFWTLGTEKSPAQAAQIAAADLLAACQRLYKAGARYFLLPGIPIFGSIPYAQDFAPQFAAPLNTFSLAFNAYLHAYAHRDAAGKGATVILFDQAAALGKFIEKKRHSPRWNVRDASLQGVYPGEAAERSLCKATKYIWWDVFHPSTRTHKYIARRALKTVVKTLGTKVLQQEVRHN